MRQAFFFLVVIALGISCAKHEVGVMTEAAPSLGNSGGNGGDLRLPEDGAAWFQGKDEPIRACLIAAKDFGVGEADLKETVQRSFATWKDYIDRKKIGAAAALATSVKWNAACDGTEELRFYFGARDALVDKAMQGYTQPVGFAQRTAYEMGRGRGKGFVWIAPPGSLEPTSGFPDWRHPYALDGILLHEIGHVLGCTHVRGTIMDAAIGALLKDLHRYRATRLTQFYLTQIDHARQLYFCPECGLDVEGRLAGSETFRSLAGEAQRGAVSTHLTLSADRASGDLRGGLLLTLYGGHVSFPLELPAASRKEFSTGLAVFKTVRFDSTFNAVTTSAAEGGRGVVFSGWITAASGKKFSVRLEINGGDRQPLLDWNRNSWSLYGDGTRPVQLEGGPDLAGGGTIFETEKYPGDRSL